MSSEDIQVKLREYKKLLDEGIINNQEFDDLKKSALQNFQTSGDMKEAVELKTISEPKPINDSQEKIVDRSTNPVIQSKPMSEREKDTLFTVLGYVFAVVAILIVPIVFGAGGVIFGYLLTRKEQTKTNGVIIIIVNIAATILGMLFGYAVWGNMMG
ncbi:MULTISPECIES: hypothetical protein [Leuconostoc]|uniref:hypothetical protein n=1 Tax=Leuconostoc TaxID=1243 RepID=UPI0018E2717A|nr:MULTISPECIES: hypothetical protein [Leuconostoc]